jgi:hypothetical protein
MSLYFHWLYRRLPGIFGFKNTPTSVLKNKIFSGMKPPIVSQGRSWVVAWDKQYKWQHSRSRQLTVNEPATGRAFDLKMETLPTISCIQ